MTVIRDLSKQIEQRARIVEAFARWLLAIAITRILMFVASSSWQVNYICFLKPLYTRFAC